MINAFIFLRFSHIITSLDVVKIPFVFDQNARLPPGVFYW
ncbi:hypothetical protein ECFDA507_3397 [Escherichia coli FDA507]|nr:hypothetical protein ECFDA507_3397 [Escherichia coli FDA507]